MKVFIIDPYMTMADTSGADEFNEEVIKQLKEYGVGFFVVTDKNIVSCKRNLCGSVLVIVYNERNMSGELRGSVQEFLKKAIEINALIYPIAIDKSARIPAKIIEGKQSYDVWEQLRCRNLEQNYWGIIAKIFSRKIIARAFPTCYCEEGEVFLSHRRLDGEEITAQIYDKMIVQAKEATPFRDVVNVKTGEEAQKIIDNIMENTDVFVFLHTQKSGESDWILKELRFALLRQIPVLWIQIDDADVESLRLKPSDKPHLRYKSEDLGDDKKLTKIVDEILQKAFELIMDRSNQILGYVDLEKMFGKSLKEVDKEKLIYHISMKRKGYHYPQRNIEQYCQLFGRTPTSEDAGRLNTDYGSKDIDSAVILTNRVVASSIKNNVVIDSIQDFLYHWSQYIIDEKKGIEKMGKMEIIISGAFPDSDEIFKQSLTDALILFAKVIIRDGYDLTFGAHPTFQELFYEVAKEIAPQNYRSKINMYISEWFLTQGSEKEKEYREKYNLFITPKKKDLPQSLREMRKEMIQRESVKALVCLGGKIKDNKKEEGIREEIELARQKKIPVFIVGSVGGCSSQVALEYKDAGWNKLNDAPIELNQEFIEGIDYYKMAQEMIAYINSDKKE